ncbi:MAG TPA: dienelactone hydrolase family protein [Mobilitalea sp.]|nr:dienelactone hydrolase family protein [Mobilitalea sp.]
MKKTASIFALFSLLSVISLIGKDTNIARASETGIIINSAVILASSTDNKKSDKDSQAAKKDIGSKNEDKELSELGKLSKKLALQMIKGEFKETYNTLSVGAKQQLTLEYLEQVWNDVVTDLGSYKGIRSITEEKVKTNTVVNVILNYDNCGMLIQFSYNTYKKLDGLWITYAPYEPEPVSNKYFEETIITFGDKKKPIKGILTLPKNVKKPPVAILVPGSGDHDADESIAVNKPFRDLAHGLAKQGIAVIRYNESTPLSSKPEFTIQDDSLNDAAQAIKYAKTLKSVDKNRIYIIGHSLGGMMAPKIAADNKEVKGIVCLAGSPRKLEDIIVDQTRKMLEADKSVTPEMLKIYMAQLRPAVNKIKELKEGSTEIIFNYPASYWYSLNQIDIPKIVKKLNIPIFIAQGSEDFQVFADIDYEAWKDILKNKNNVTFKLYDNLNHLFMKSNGRTDVTEYSIKGTVDSRVINDIVKWIKKN